MTPAHEQINLCGLFIKMGLERPGRVDEGSRGVLVTALLIFPGTEIVCIGKGLVRIDDDEVGISNTGVREVSTETGLENGEDSVIVGVYSELGGGGDEVDKVSADHRHGSLKTKTWSTWWPASMADHVDHDLFREKQET